LTKLAEAALARCLSTFFESEVVAPSRSWGGSELNGFLDELDQAFLTIDCGLGALDFLVDTGFTGSLMIGAAFFDPSKAKFVGTIEVELAAGQTCELRRYELSFSWLGSEICIRVLLGSGKECLVGTQLLNPHRLEIDYSQRTVSLQAAPNW
jgi:predicted aspartyl protease